MTSGKLQEAHGAQLVFVMSFSERRERQAQDRGGMCAQAANSRRFTAENDTVKQLYSG